MTDNEADAIAEGMLQHLKKYDPAEAMGVLALLSAKAILSATPKHIGAIDHSLKLFFEGVIGSVQTATRSLTQ